jgi:hypothetical protein
MRSTALPAIFTCLALSLLAPLHNAQPEPRIPQESRTRILVSHDSIDGPRGPERHVNDLEIFDNGKVSYTEEGTNMMGVKQERSSHETTLEPEQMRHLRELLESREIRSLPETVSAKTNPIDFFWQKSLEVIRPNQTQKIQIENFYPFLNLHHTVYPEALVELECDLQDIEAAAAKRAPDDWCKDLLNGEKTAKRTQADCDKDGSQVEIIADEGWGPIRVGSPQKGVEGFLGKGKSGRRYSDVYFENYEAKGLQVSFNNASNTVHAIYFYNGQRDSPEFATFCGQVEKSINWQSSIDDVEKAFGKPAKEFSGTDLGGTWTRLVFDGIDFRFENGKMVRIGVPGR